MNEKMNSKAVEYSIEVPHHDKYFFLVRNFMENILKVENLPDKDCDEIIIAVNEACDKLFREELHSLKDANINIKVRINKRKIVVTLSYKGSTKLAGYLKTINEERVVLESVKDKIGEYLIEKNADEVSYSKSKKRGFNVKITKFRGRKNG
jgi:anti-sigma regulatory factor (Ser/Thr protein kinase)